MTEAIEFGILNIIRKTRGNKTIMMFNPQSTIELLTPDTRHLKPK
jgi:hypothetical protein